MKYAMLLVLFLSGCLTTTMSIKRSADGTIVVTQPKDVCFEELTYTVDGNEVLSIKKYSSMANTQALQIQADVMSGIASGVASGVVGAMK